MGSQQRGGIKKRGDKGKARFSRNMGSRVHRKELTWKKRKEISSSAIRRKEVKIIV